MLGTDVSVYSPMGRRLDQTKSDELKSNSTRISLFSVDLAICFLKAVEDAFEREVENP